MLKLYLYQWQMLLNVLLVRLIVLLHSVCGFGSLSEGLTIYSCNWINLGTYIRSSDAMTNVYGISCLTTMSFIILAAIKNIYNGGNCDKVAFNLQLKIGRGIRAACIFWALPVVRQKFIGVVIQFSDNKKGSGLFGKALHSVVTSRVQFSERMNNEVANEGLPQAEAHNEPNAG